MIQTLLGAILLSVCSWTQAQAGEEALRGVTALKIVIEDLDEDNAACGVTEDALDAAVRLPLSSASLRVRSDVLPYIYVRVTSLRILDFDGCVTSVSVRFSRPMWAAPVDGLQSPAVVWDKGTLLTGRRHSMSKRVNDTVEGLTKQFAAAVLKARN